MSSGYDKPTYEDTIQERQKEIAEWHARTFKRGSDQRLQSAAKIAEEAGEVLGAVIKDNQDVPTKSSAPSREEAMRQELGDVFITALQFASEMGWDARDILNERWYMVQRRSMENYHGAADI